MVLGFLPPAQASAAQFASQQLHNPKDTFAMQIYGLLMKIRSSKLTGCCLHLLQGVGYMGTAYTADTMGAAYFVCTANTAGTECTANTTGTTGTMGTGTVSAQPPISTTPNLSHRQGILSHPSTISACLCHPIPIHRCSVDSCTSQK